MPEKSTTPEKPWTMPWRIDRSNSQNAVLFVTNFPHAREFDSADGENKANARLANAADPMFDALYNLLRANAAAGVSPLHETAAAKKALEMALGRPL